MKKLFCGLILLAGSARAANIWPGTSAPDLPDGGANWVQVHLEFPLYPDPPNITLEAIGAAGDGHLVLFGQHTSADFLVSDRATGVGTYLFSIAPNHYFNPWPNPLTITLGPIDAVHHAWLTSYNGGPYVPVTIGSNPRAGDFDANGEVNASDFMIWQRNLGRTDATISSGDTNGDQIVDSLDVEAIKANFVKPRAVGSVPEPAGWALALWALLFRKGR